MIKINLLPQRKTKRVSEPGQGQIVAGVGVLAAAAALVFFVVHSPLASERKQMQDKADELAASNNVTQAKLKDYETLKKFVAEQTARDASIKELEGARAVPANLLHELGEILTLGKKPTMTAQMQRLVESDPSRRIALDWDPKHAWITSLTENKGDFILEGGAQSDTDVTQLAKRMQASVYFNDVSPANTERITDTKTGVSYFKFIITGKVVY